MKKRISTIIAVISIAIPAIILFIVFALPNLKYLLRDTREFTFDDVTRVEIRSGFGMGFTATTETDPETVERLATRAVYGTFEKGEKLPDYTGYSYILRFYDGDELVDTLTVLSSNTLDYNGYLYTGDGHDGAGVDTDYLDELLYTALPLDELLTYDIPFVDDLLRDFAREKIVSLYGEPDSFAENGASVYRAAAFTLYINYTDDMVSSVWIAENAPAELPENGLDADAGSLDDLLDLGLDAVEDAFIGLAREEVISRFGYPEGIADSTGEEVYETEDARVLLVYDASGVVSSLTAYTERYSQFSGQEMQIFDYETDAARYAADAPNVKRDGFVNTEALETAPTLFDGVIEHAARECTVDYDTVTVSVDDTYNSGSGGAAWRVVFSTEGVAGGDQTVYLDALTGETLLIVYGE